MLRVCAGCRWLSLHDDSIARLIARGNWVAARSAALRIDGDNAAAAAAPDGGGGTNDGGRAAATQRYDGTADEDFVVLSRGVVVANNTLLELNDDDSARPFLRPQPPPRRPPARSEIAVAGVTAVELPSAPGVSALPAGAEAVVAAAGARPREWTS